jgi:predicted amidophosphoribosyltransferase
MAAKATRVQHIRAAGHRGLPAARGGSARRARSPGQAVLLLDDTWASGGTPQSAAVALKRAGARSVAVIVAGRHLPAITGSAGACPGTEERASRAAGQ